MAHGRPLSRHGRYDTHIGMPVAEASSSEFYKQSDYSASQYGANHSDIKTQIAAARYDQYARVNTPRDELQAYSLLNYGNYSHRRMSLEGSDESFTPSPPSQPMVSPDSSFRKMYTTQPRPPSASSHPPTSGRPPSASSRLRSARRQKSDMEMPQIPVEDMPDMSSVARPPSSFSKYRPLPAIGTPVPDDVDDSPPINHLYNVVRTSSRGPPYQQDYDSDTQHHQPPLPQEEKRTEVPSQPQSGKKQHRSHKRNARISSAVSDVSAISTISDISVISSHATARSQKPREDNFGAELVERLDLSQLDKADGGRRRKPAHSSSKTNPSAQPKIAVDTGDLYDGDADDSDTSAESPISKHESSVLSHTSAKSLSTKKPVVIPSQHQPPPKEILLAVKLPTDGSRHQRYFNTHETLQSIVDFAEEVASQDFGGYILVVASAPKNVYVDLHETIENAGLEDKTVLHLEEYDD